MLINTEGIVISRKAFKEYDEKIVCLTSFLGKITIFSFGSRSLNSLRGINLNEKAFLELQLKKKDHFYTLENVEIINHPISLLLIEDQALFQLLDTFIKYTSNYLRYEETNSEFFLLIKEISAFLLEEKQTKDIDYYNIIFYLTFFFLTGSYPYFVSCAKCHKICSNEYFYDRVNQHYIGATHYLFSKDKFIKIALEDIVFIQKYYHYFKLNKEFFSLQKKQLFTGNYDIENLSRYIDYIKFNV